MEFQIAQEYWPFYDWLLENWLCDDWSWLFNENLWLTHYWLNNCSLKVIMGFKMNSASWVTSKEQFDPFLSFSSYSKEVYSDCCIANHFCNIRISAASLNNSRSLFTPIQFYNNKWRHSLEETSVIMLKMSLFKVKSEIS